jgi:hypothetical protein
VTDSVKTTTPPMCTTCGAHPALRGGTQCATCHPLTSHDAYRAGLCCQCRSTRYSAGRPRCKECHAEYTTSDQSRAMAS